MTFGAALVCRAEFPRQDFSDIEFERSAPFPLSPLQRAEGRSNAFGRRRWPGKTAASR